MPVRTIIHEHRFYEDALAIVGSTRLLDRALDPIELALAQAPERGTYVGNGVWSVTTEVRPLGVRLAIYDTFDESTVTLHRALRRAL